MGGFIAMQMTAIEPNLFQSSILINPVCVTFPELRHHNLKVYQDWYHRDFVKFYFDNIPEGENGIIRSMNITLIDLSTENFILLFCVIC